METPKPCTRASTTGQPTPEREASKPEAPASTAKADASRLRPRATRLRFKSTTSKATSKGPNRTTPRPTTTTTPRPPTTTITPPTTTTKDPGTTTRPPQTPPQRPIKYLFTPSSADKPSRNRNKTTGKNRVRKPPNGSKMPNQPSSAPPPPTREERLPNLPVPLKAAGVTVLVPGDREYERAVASNNLLYRFTRPEYVLRPHNVGHVQAIVREAVLRKESMTIKNGGHSYSASSFPMLEPIMLDMKYMNKVDYDWKGVEMTIQGGALWANVYRVLSVAGGHEGVIVNGGRCPSVGVVGFLLGGGIGPFSREFGMAVDCLREITIVCADGEVYTVRMDDAPESKEGKLFWALCGAGGGNFGVVVEVKIDVLKLKGYEPFRPSIYGHKPDSDQQLTQLVSGRDTWFPRIGRGRPDLYGYGSVSDDSSGWLDTMNHFYTYNWPRSMTIDTSWISDLQVQDGDIAIRFNTYFDGVEDRFDKLIDKGVVDPRLAKQLKRRANTEFTTRFWHETLAAQWDTESKVSIPVNSTFRLYHSFCFTNDPADIERITAIVKEELEAFKRLFIGLVGMCQVTFIHAGGQASERNRDATAFRWRDANFHVYIMVQWKDKWLEMDMRGFAGKFKNRLRQFTIADVAGFVNFPDASMSLGLGIDVRDHMMVYYGNNKDKLMQIKRMWDPKNYFKWEQGIKPAEKDDKWTVREANQTSRIFEDHLSDGGEDFPEARVEVEAACAWDSRRSTAYHPLLTLGEEAFSLGDYLIGEDDPNKDGAPGSS